MAKPIINAGIDGSFSQGLQSFYSKKSVLPSWKFLVTINTDDDIQQTGENAGNTISPKIKSAFSNIDYHHVVDVTIPFYKFSMESVKYGPVAKTFPKLDHNGFNITITFEDDSNGNVLDLIHQLQKTIVDDDGFYKRLNLNKIGNINIQLYNHYGLTVGEWIAHGAYYTGVNDLTLSYANNDTVKFGLNFGCDTIQFYKSQELMGNLTVNYTGPGDIANMV